MRLSPAVVLPALVAATSAGPSVHELFANSDASTARIPSVHESTVQARRILHIRSLSTASTIFPPSYSDGFSAQEDRPADVANTAMGLMEYHADCGPEPWNPTMLAVTISTTMKNVVAGSNVTLSVRHVVPHDAPMPPPDPYAYVPANLPRFALIGTVEPYTDEEVQAHNISGCFLQRHPEATIWQPGSDVHTSYWARVVVKQVYFFGGFGNIARIGWLPLEEWQNVTMEEVLSYRLVGEEGYKHRASAGELDGAQVALSEEL